MNQLIVAIILSILPISELRGAMIYAIGSGLIKIMPIYIIAIITTLANILIVFFVFFFLDFLHHRFMNILIYRRFFNFYIKKLQRKIDKFEKNFSVYGFLALTIFVAIPLPATGAWTGCLIAWILGLERKKSIFSIVLGVLIAGILVLLAGLGIINIIKLA